MVALEARPSNVEGEGLISVADLVRRALRMNADRVIVGEVLGDEILPMLNAMSQGRSGSMCTIHSDSSAGVFRRIASYAVQAPEHLPLEASNLLVAGAIHFVVHLDSEMHEDQSVTESTGSRSDWLNTSHPESAGEHHRFPSRSNRQRFVSSIREVVDAEGVQVVSNEIFRPGPDRRAIPESPLRPETLRELPRLRVRALPLRPSWDDGVNVALVVASGLFFGLGIVGVATSWRAGAPATSRAARTNRALTALRNQVPPLALAGVCGVVAGLVTGWPVATPIAAVAVFGLPKLFRQTSGSVSIVRIESIATWTEMLQGTLAASAGLGQAIIATAPLSPPPIRGAATRLSARISAGMHPHDALLQFADELEDPCADRVICALQLAVASRAQRVGDLLVALADSTRDEVALRLRVEVSRASVRSGVRTVIVFSIAFAVGLALLAHSYLSPFGTTHGQLVLMVVGVLYGCGMTLMVSMSRPPAPVRLLGDQVVEQ